MTPRRWRSRCEMLFEGSTDGKYDKTIKDWNQFPGMGTDLTAAQRGDLLRQNGLGSTEPPHKYVPGQWKS